MPTRARARAGSARRPPRREGRTRLARPSLALLALVALGLGAACGGEDRRSVPAELRGTWRTEEGPYARRYLEIRRDEIVFGAAARSQDLELETLEVRGVHRERGEEGSRVFRLRLRAPQGYDETMVLRYRSRPEATLQIARRDATWRRSAP